MAAASGGGGGEGKGYPDNAPRAMGGSAGGGGGGARPNRQGTAAAAAATATDDAGSAVEMPATASDGSGTPGNGIAWRGACGAATATTAATATAAEPLVAGALNTGAMVGRRAARTAAAAECAAAKGTADAEGTVVGGGVAAENLPAGRWPRRRGSCGCGAWLWGGEWRRWETTGGVGTASERRWRHPTQGGGGGRTEDNRRTGDQISPRAAALIGPWRSRDGRRSLPVNFRTPLATAYDSRMRLDSEYCQHQPVFLRPFLLGLTDMQVRCQIPDPLPCQDPHETPEMSMRQAQNMITKHAIANSQNLEMNLVGWYFLSISDA